MGKDLGNATCSEEVAELQPKEAQEHEVPEEEHGAGCVPSKAPRGARWRRRRR